MTNDFSPSVGKIVADYLRRLGAHLKGLPERDRTELVDEVYSHIYESFLRDAGSDEVDRIFNVLNRLGEPEVVAADRVSASLVERGKKRKRPLLIAGGVLIGLLGLPVGIGGAVIGLSLAVGVLTLVAVYFLTAASLTVLGSLGFLITVFKWISPDFMAGIGLRIGLSPDFDNLPARLLLSCLSSGIGLLMFWAGRRLIRGLKFVLSLVPKGIKNYKDRRRLKALGLQP